MTSNAETPTLQEDLRAPSGDVRDHASRALLAICMQLLHHSQWKSDRKFYCGSSVEIPLHDIIAKHFKLNKEQLDVDIMCQTTELCAVQRSASLPEKYKGLITRIYTDDVHIAYGRLILENCNADVLLSEWYTMDVGEMKHGPAIMCDSKCIALMQCNQFSLSNIAADLNLSEKSYIGFVDRVYAIHCPYWPQEATEWITRSRSHGFPSKSVIKQVVRYGCDFVQISHNRFSNDNEWRISFSRAELFISKSWTTAQRIVYDTLWVLHKRIGSSNLCTYYFKTLMLWACEEKETQFWSEELLVQSVCELLLKMMQLVKSKCCINYFIRNNNMIDHLIDTDLSYEIDTLWRTLQSLQLITDIIDTCRRYELKLVNTKWYLESPAWIKRAYVIYTRVNNHFDNYTDLFNTDIATDLQKALYIELSDISSGIFFHQESIRSVNMSDKHINFLKSESHLSLAVNLYKSQKRDVLNNFIMESKSIIGNFLACDTYISNEASNDIVELSPRCKSTAHRHNLLNDHNEHKCLLYSRLIEMQRKKLSYNSYYDWSERIGNCGNVNISVFQVTKTKTSTDTAVRHLKERPGRSPTVNTSWFIAKAYLANLYYRNLCDINLKMKTCDDIIDACKQSYMNKEFAERTFPFVLSTQCTSIYDISIRELLGFYSLCSYVFDPSIRSVYLGVCSVQFALYLKLRIAINHGISDWSFKYSEYCEHVETCVADSKRKKEALILHISLIMLLAKIHPILS